MQLSLWLGRCSPVLRQARGRGSQSSRPFGISRPRPYVPIPISFPWDLTHARFYAKKITKTSPPLKGRNDFKTMPIEKEIQRAEEEATRLDYESTRTALRQALFQKRNFMSALDLARNYAMKRYRELGRAKLEDSTFYLYRLIVEYFAQRNDTARLPLVTDSMRRIGLPMTANTYGDFIYVVGKKGHLLAAVSLLRRLQKDGLTPTTYVYNVLIDSFVTAGDAKSTMKFFEEMAQNKVKPDTVTYNLILSLLTRAKDIDSSVAQGIFEEMTTRGVPLNEATVIFLLNIFSHSNDEAGVLKILKVAEDSKIPLSLKCYPALISLYSKKEDYAKAMEWLALCRDRGLKPDALCYGPILELCRSSKRASAAMSLFDEMKADGVQMDSLCLSIYIHFLFQQGLHEAALRAFEEAHERKVKFDIALFDILFRGLLPLPSLRSKCHDYFKWMVHAGLKQNAQILASMLDLCLYEGDYPRAAQYFENAKKFFVPETEHFNALMALCSKKGLNQEVVNLFEELEAVELKPDILSYKAVLNAYISLGRFDDLSRVYQSMVSHAVPPSPALRSQVMQALEGAGRTEEAKKLSAS